MKRFLKITALLSAATMLFMGICFMKADGTIDPFYIRFTTPKQHSLILGSSRAAQGLQPQIFNEKLNSQAFNFAFTNANSPYGPIYLRAIKKKLEASTHGIYILDVHPWTIASKANHPNDTAEFREQGLMLDYLNCFNLNPNVEYLLRSYDKPFYNILIPGDTNVFLHQNGWLEISVSMDSARVKNRTTNKIDHYANLQNSYAYSSARLKHLEKTVNYLSAFGEVYLVRIPVCEGILQVENRLMPRFNDLIDSISTRTNVLYFDLMEMNDSLVYTDGNHLYKESGKLVSQALADSILNHRKRIK